jgi:hypothetical protein
MYIDIMFDIIHMKGSRFWFFEFDCGGEPSKTSLWARDIVLALVFVILLDDVLESSFTLGEFSLGEKSFLGRGLGRCVLDWFLGKFRLSIADVLILSAVGFLGFFIESLI